jgi:hypothetical protein
MNASIPTDVIPEECNVNPYFPVFEDELDKTGESRKRPASRMASTPDDVKMYVKRL